MLAKETIICLAAAAWDGMWARAQQMMTILASMPNRVLFVEPPVTCLAPLKNRENIKLIGSRLKKAGENIIVLRPRVQLPFGNMYRTVNRLNQRLLYHQIKSTLAGLGWKPSITWTCLPGSVDLPDLPGCFLLYDCADEHAAFPGLISPLLVSAMEKELFSRADLAVVSARALYQAKALLREDLLLVPNGADVEHFQRALDPGLETAPEISRLPRPVIGYVGAISPWLDQELLAALADAEPDFSLVLIGPVDTDISLLSSRKNVHFLGYRPYLSLPSCLKGFDVAVIPFKINSLTRGVNPVKLYEYLSAGLPVVTTGLPEARPFAPLVEVALTAQDFVSGVRKMASRGREDGVRARLELASSHAWRERVETIAQAIGEKRSATGLKSGLPE